MEHLELVIGDLDVKLTVIGEVVLLALQHELTEL